MSYRPSRRERILSALEIHRSRIKLSDYVDGLTITIKVIQPRGRKEPKRQAAEVMQDVMLSSQGGRPSSIIQLHRKCYKCGQKGHYAKSCPQKRLSPVALVLSSVSSKTGGCNQVQQCQRVCTRQTMKAQDLGTITSPARTSGDKAHLVSGNCSKQGAQNDQDQQQVIPGVRRA